MREYERENALGKNALLVFLSLIFILISGMKVARAQQVIYVDQLQRYWPDAVKTIAEGIEKAKNSNCTEIWVAAGTYKERVKLAPGICLYGGFTGEEVLTGYEGREEVRGNRDILTNETIIDAELKGTAITGASRAVIGGFTIKNGKAAQGGGILCNVDNPSAGAAITIMNCMITGNEATSGNGGGIYLCNYKPTIINCQVIENKAPQGAGGGISLLSTMDGVIKNNEILRNTSSKGAGLYINSAGAQVSIQNNLISRNITGSSGGGLYMERSTTPLVSNNVIAQNQAVTGGGGIYLWRSNPLFINDTIAENYATMNAYSELVCQLAQPTVQNCIIWSIGGGEAVYSQYPMTKVTYSDISNLESVEIEGPDTNINQDPKFKDTAYHLQTGADGSVCIDAGDPASPADRDMSPNDMGAYGGQGAGRVGCDYTFPVIDVKLDPIPGIEASNPDGAIIWFVISPIYPDNSLGIYLNEALIVELKDDDGLPPQVVITDSIGVPLNPDSISLANGTNSLTIIATDGIGHKSVRSITIEVIDTTLPEISCPDSITVEAEGPDGVPATNAAIQAFLNSATATDTVDGSITPTHDAPGMFKIEETVVTFTATDKAGQSVTCPATVTVVDTTPPDLNCPDAITIEAEGPDGVAITSEAIQAFLNSAAATDIVDGSITPTHDAPEMFKIEETVVTFTVTDSAGKTSTCPVTVTVVDTTPPDLNCPDAITLEAEGPDGVAITSEAIQAFLNSAAATDIVDGSLTPTHDAPEMFKIEETVVTFTVTDSAGKTSTCPVTVTVQDTTPPDLNCPDAITLEAEGPGGVAITNEAIQAFLNSAAATDIVDGSLTPTHDAPDMFKIEETVVTFTVTDSAGRTSSCPVTVTVQDTTPPDLNCPDAITLEAEGPDGVAITNEAIQAFLNSAAATDIVDGSITPTHDAPDMFKIEETVVTFTATDNAGKSRTCTAIVTVKDTIAPVITNCPGDLTIKSEGPNGVPRHNAGIQAFLDGFTATDNSGEVNVNNNAPDIFPVGDTVVTFTVTDGANNTSTCNATVNVMRSEDVNGDGKLSAADAMFTFQCYLGEGPCNQGCDVDGDGRVSSRDALCVFQKYLGEPSCLD